MSRSTTSLKLVVAYIAIVTSSSPVASSPLTFFPITNGLVTPPDQGVPLGNVPTASLGNSYNVYFMMKPSGQIKGGGSFPTPGYFKFQATPDAGRFGTLQTYYQNTSVLPNPNGPNFATVTGTPIGQFIWSAEIHASGEDLGILQLNFTNSTNGTAYIQPTFSYQVSAARINTFKPVAQQIATTLGALGGVIGLLTAGALLTAGSPYLGALAIVGVLSQGLLSAAPNSNTVTGISAALSVRDYVVSSIASRASDLGAAAAALTRLGYASLATAAAQAVAQAFANDPPSKTPGQAFAMTPNGNIADIGRNVLDSGLNAVAVLQDFEGAANVQDGGGSTISLQLADLESYSGYIGSLQNSLSATAQELVALSTLLSPMPADCSFDASGKASLTSAIGEVLSDPKFASLYNSAGGNLSSLRDDAQAMVSGAKCSPSEQFASTMLSTAHEMEVMSSFVSTSPEAVAAVPEPATWSMMICGMALIGVAMRRSVLKVRV